MLALFGLSQYEQIGFLAVVSVVFGVFLFVRHRMSR